MKLSLKTYAGKPEMPVVLLIHGLGMNNYFWVDPKKMFSIRWVGALDNFSDRCSKQIQ